MEGGAPVTRREWVTMIVWLAIACALVGVGIRQLDVHHHAPRTPPVQDSGPGATTSTTRREAPGVVCWVDGHRIVTNAAGAAQLRCDP